MQRREQITTALTLGAILGLTAWSYWPATHGVFIWDDTSTLHDIGWLRGDAWKESALRGFGGWINYFRPLVVLLFAAETHVFDVQPAPMHVVSLCLHLINTLLVALLALRVAAHNAPSLRPALVAAIASAFYGLHPALIEPVDWLGCQVELTLVLFMLLGLLLNAQIAGRRRRAFAVGTCFFLAACAKEAAVTFPMLLVLLDLATTQPANGWREQLSAAWRRQRSVYLIVVLAGLAYLIFRFWALGYTVVSPGAEPLLSLARLQRVCLTYLSYWKLIVWPMTAIGPLHPIDESQFAGITFTSLTTDAAALAIVAGGLWASSRRHAIGFAVLAASVALLPVLNLVPIPFNEGLYHDRYATTAVAMSCVLLPSALVQLRGWRQTRIVMPLLAAVWLGLAITAIRVTVPLWNDELALWQWALRENPGSITAKDHLLSTYIIRNDHEHARALADALVASNTRCPVCMLNAAYLAISENDSQRAALALGKLKDTNVLAYDKGILRGYVFANGGLLELEGDLAGAEEAYRDAITLDPLDPVSHFTLATLLAKEGRTTEARATAEIALPMFAPDEREQRRAVFEQALAGKAH